MNRSLALLVVLCLLAFPGRMESHPGSGIVVDRQGNVYFIDTGAGIWKIDRSGKLTKLGGPSFHWLAIDLDGRLADATLPYFSSESATVTRVGTNPTLLASSDFPLTVGRDGSLYYPWASGDEVKIFRLDPSGARSEFKALPPARAGGGKTGDLRWRNGIVASPDGSIYYSEDNAVRRISAKGELTTVIENIAAPGASAAPGKVNVAGCAAVPGVEGEIGPYCRGLDVDSAGTVYVAVTGCGAVLKIAPDKTVSVVLRAETPWSPTSVAVSGRDLYVLEYFHTVEENRPAWVPRVRKVSSDGSVVTLATVSRR